MMEEELETLIVGKSPAVRELRRLILRFAPTSLPVLIEGPTGAGKELVAQGLHLASGRRGKFVAVNLCALGDGTFESDMFGHVRGAFTGASEARDGYFVEAHGGTIFLDEIAELSLTRQAKLLRVIDTRTIRPVGGSADRAIDCRVVAATNAGLEKAAQASLFRSDFYHRLCGAVLTVPALCARVDDIPLLARHFAAASPGQSGGLRVTAAAVEWLRRRPWPGNVRQLRHLIDRAAVWATDGEIDMMALDEAERLGRGDRSVGSLGETAERRKLLDMLEEHRWHIEPVARACRVAVGTVYARIKRHGIVIPHRYRRRDDLPDADPQIGV